jgi:hypothetical protein
MILLKSDIMRLLGRYPRDEKKAEEEWTRLEEYYNSLKEADRYDSWKKVRSILSIVLGQSAINWLKEQYEELFLEKFAKEKTVDNCIEKIDGIYGLLQRVKLLEGTIKKQQEIENAYLSVQVDDRIVKVNEITAYGDAAYNYGPPETLDKFALKDLMHQFSPMEFDSIEVSITLEDLGGFRSSMQQRLDKVGLAYGSDWKTRVGSLNEQLRKTKQNKTFDKKNPIHSFSVLFCCAILIGRDLGSRSKLLTNWDLEYRGALGSLKEIRIENKKIIFKIKIPYKHRSGDPESRFYLINLNGFEAYKNNFVARMMLADAILKTHPFKV